MTNQRYNFQLEVVTPLSVGAGNQNDWVKGADFVQYKNKLYVLDIRKMVEYGLDIDKINMCFINQDEESICKLLGNHIEEVSRYVFDLPVITDNPIKTFLRTQLFDRPLVPGSSIKGSIRSALFNFLRDEERNDKEVFGSMKTGDDFMRFLQIGDVEMKRTILANTKIFNLHIDQYQEWAGGWKESMKATSDKFQANKFNTLYECVPPGEKGLGTIIMAAASYEQLLTVIENGTPHVDKKQALMGEGIKKLFKVINNVTKNYLRKEKKFFSHFEADRSDEIVDCIDYLIGLIPDDNSSCLMKMSAGVGFHSITGDWQYVNNYINTGFIYGKKKYKSRKIAEYNGKLMLMGFARLSCVPKDKAAEELSAIYEEHQVMMNDIRLAPERRSEILRLKEQEKKEMMEKAKRQQILQKEYEELISQAKQLYLDDKNKEAEELVLIAESLWPDGPEHQELLTKIHKSINYEEEQRKANEDKRKQYLQPLSDLLKGKNSCGLILKCLEKWLEEDANSFGDDEKVALVNAFQLLSNKEKRKLKGSQKRLASLIGDEYSSAVFDEQQGTKKGSK